MYKFIPKKLFSNTESSSGIQKLLSPSKLHKLSLKNKLFMSTMTRCRAEERSGKVGEIQMIYYTQRSDAGLIFSEPLVISKDGLLGKGGAGIWEDSQIDGWARINEELHKRDTVIFGTLSHGGRVSHTAYGGENAVLGPSTIEVPFKLKISNDILDSIPTKEMTNDDIQYIFDEFYYAAKRVKKAGFDGIHLHASSGALVESFIKSSTNKREDKWGRLGGCDFAIEILKRLKDVFGEYVGIKIAPVDQFNCIYEEKPKQKYNYLTDELNKLDISFVEIKETSDEIVYEDVFDKKPSDQIPNCVDYFGDRIRKNNKTKLISNFGTKNINDAFDIMKEGKADYVSCATFYVSNPDLVYKVKNNKPLLRPRMEYYYTHGAEGYVDY